MKTSDAYRLSRLWLSLAAILLGVAAGYFIGRESVLRAVKSRLGEYAGLIEQRNVLIASETERVLQTAAASTDPPCSPQDITLLRRLTFAARYLKDVGRLNHSSLICSATSGIFEKPIPAMSPDVSIKSGHIFFLNYPLQSPQGVHAVMVAQNNANVVLSPDVLDGFTQTPIHFSVGVPENAIPGASTPSPTQPQSHADTVLSSAYGRQIIPYGVVKSSQAVQVGETIYQARCSIPYAVCAISYMSVPEIFSTFRPLMLGYTFSGALAGLSCSLAILVSGRKRRSPAKQLRRALARGTLSVAYQPIVELCTKRIVGAEALARWIDEDGEEVHPETIVSLAEAEGLMSEITRFVLTRSLSEIAPVFESNPSFRLSINLAPSDMADPSLIALLDEVLRAASITPSNIAFELSERATSNREVAVAAIHTLRARGHATFIDDFGTGYSSLAYLTELKVDGIKIDRSFTATIGTESVTASIVPQILGVARALNLSVVVHGIEREEQATYFAGNDATILAQGWFFGLPIPAKGLIYLCAEKSE